jgi:hypothetical protein
MDEPWMVARGSDDAGPFVVKLKGRFKKAEARVGLPIRLSILIEGHKAVRSVLKGPDNGEAVENSFYEYARRKGGALVATIWRAERYTYLIHLPSGALDDSPFPISEAARPYLRTEICGDVDWDEYCGFLEARVEKPNLFERLRAALGRHSR